MEGGREAGSEGGMDGWREALPHPGTRPPVLWTGRMQVWTGIPVQPLVVDW